jgi:hypothetical protein
MLKGRALGELAATGDGQNYLVSLATGTDYAAMAARLVQGEPAH